MPADPGDDRGLSPTRTSSDDAADCPSTAEQMQALRASAQAADACGALQPPQVEAIHRHRWLAMLAPRAIGGDEWPLPEVVRLEERLAQADGSCAWVVTLCAGAGWFAGFLPPALAREVLATDRCCIAGSGAPTGIAERDGDDWRLTGRWAHASGAQLATHYTLVARLHDGGAPLLDDIGRPRTHAFIVPATAVQVDADSWHATGLRASTSRAFALDGVRVPSDHAFDLEPHAATADGPLYRFPFRALAFVTLAACLAGMARRFVDLAEPLAARPVPSLDGPLPAPAASLQGWADGDRRLRDARDALLARLDAVWDRHVRSRDLDADAAQWLEAGSRDVARAAREAVDAIHPLCGLQAVDRRSEIERVWRDLHTATQHAIWRG